MNENLRTDERLHHVENLRQGHDVEHACGLAFPQHGVIQLGTSAIHGLMDAEESSIEGLTLEHVRQSLLLVISVRPSIDDVRQFIDQGIESRRII